MNSVKIPFKIPSNPTKISTQFHETLITNPIKSNQIPLNLTQSHGHLLLPHKKSISCPSNLHSIRPPHRIIDSLTKDVTIVSSSSVVFGDPISHQQMVGFMVTLFGMALWSPSDALKSTQKPWNAAGEWWKWEKHWKSYEKVAIDV